MFWRGGHGITNWVQINVGCTRNQSRFIKQGLGFKAAFPLLAEAKEHSRQTVRRGRVMDSPDENRPDDSSSELPSRAMTSFITRVNQLAQVNK